MRKMGFALGLALTGCPPIVEDTVVGGTDDTEVETTEGMPLDETQAEQAYNMVGLPVYLLFMFMGTDAECPTLTEVDDGDWLLETDCTDEDGYTWSGSAEMLEDAGVLDVSWNDLGFSGDDGSVSFNGTQYEDATGMLTSNLTLVIETDDPGEDTPTGTTTYTDHVIDSQGYLSIAFGGAGAYSVSGQMDSEGLGDFTLSGTVSADEKTCDREPDGGVLTFSGPSSIAYSHDGAELCDGCIPYETEGEFGSLCLWDWEEWDTGFDTGVEDTDGS